MPRHARGETALVDLGRLVLEGASPCDLMRAAPALIAAELRLDYVQLFDLPPLDNAVRLMASTGPDQAAIGCVEQLEPDSLLADLALRAGEPVIISDWQGESRLKPPAVLREAAISSSVSIAITAGRGEPIHGFLSVHSRKPRLFPDDEIQFLKTVGNLLAYAVASARSARSFSALLENVPDVIVYFDKACALRTRTRPPNGRPELRPDRSSARPAVTWGSWSRSCRRGSWSCAMCGARGDGRLLN